uniref:Uncharacterized protein n=1 Tax=Magallana gigas TaxID=29159 RepID=A0A8W8LE21_MAGGI|nr:uncharacterized protein LOC105337595 [Crassostrea gigas]
MSTVSVSTVVISAAVITVGSFLWFNKPADYHDESVKETGSNSLDSTNCNDDLTKCVKDAVKSEFQKYRKENEETSDLQIYKKGEVEQVLSPEQLNAIVEEKVKQVIDKYIANQQDKYIADLQDKIDNLEKKVDLRKNEVIEKSETVPEHFENDYLERLLKLESFMREKEKDSNPNVNYFENIIDILSSTASGIKELYSVAKAQAYSSWSNITNVAVVEYSKQNVSAGQTVVITTIVFLISAILELFCCLCICRRFFRWCRRKRRSEYSTKEKNISGAAKKGTLPDEELKRSYQKLENSLCVISFSEEYVNSYHLQLAKSLIEYMYQGKHGELSHIKKVTITKPDNLNSVPRSKVFIVCVDYNERNDILEPDSPNKSSFLVRRSTVRSLMDSKALVILVYCLEKSSEHLGVGDRYAFKLHSKIVAVEETKELDEKNYIFSVYKKFSTFQLGALKQTVGEYLKKLEEIVS